MATPSTYTPGPYSASTMTMSRKAWASLNKGPLNIVQRGPDVLAVVWSDDDSSEQAQARLFAAAPETAAERDHLRNELLELNEVHFETLGERDRLRKVNADLLAALEAVVAIADRKTAEFDRARAAIAKAKGGAA